MNICTQHKNIIGFYEGKEYKISDVSDKNLEYLCLECKNPLVPCLNTGENKSYFRHKSNKNFIPNPQPMSDWHKSWQSLFESTEIKFSFSDGSFSRADVVSGNTIIELQHSIISKEEIESREAQYKSINKNLVWILDGTDYVLKNCTEDEVETKETFTIIKLPTWVSNNFLNVPVIYIDKDNFLYKVEIPHIKYDYYKTTNGLEKSLVINSLKNDTFSSIWENQKYIQPKLTILQKGAGVGKTWESVQQIRKKKPYIKTFIYLTKMRSAIEVIYNEVKDQKPWEIKEVKTEEKENNLPNQYEEFKKQYKIVPVDKSITIIIGTVDSFMWAIRNPDTTYNCRDVFLKLAQTIVHDNRIKEHSGYAGGVKLCMETLLVVDEVQDLDISYMNAFITVAGRTGTDLYVIGDKLQSIMVDENIMNDAVQDHVLNPNIVRIYRPVSKNITRRFHNPDLMEFVNKVVHFGEFKVPEISGICDGNKCNFVHEKIPVQLELIPEQKEELEFTTGIITEVNTLSDAYNYTPEDFTFIFPILSGRTLAVHLQSKLHEFWKDKFQNINYTRKPHVQKYLEDRKKDEKNREGEYVQLHKSVEERPIDLAESKYLTRIQSIHSVKGDGRKVAFVMDLSERTFSFLRTRPKELKYESLLHVALTRAKKHMYVYYKGNGNDDIYNRLKVDNKKLQITEPPRYNLRLEKMLEHPTADKSIIEVSELMEGKMFENMDTSTDVIDYNNHRIRYSMLNTAFFLNAMKTEDDPDRGQIKTIFRRLSNAKVIYCENYFDYYNKLKKYVEDHKYTTIFIQGNYICTRSQENPVIPIIKNIQEKLRKFLRNIDENKLDLCVLELVILTFLYETETKKLYSDFKMAELYTVITRLSQYKHGDGCICDKIFANVDKRENSVKKIHDFYNKFNHIENRFDKLTKEITEKYQEKFKHVTYQHVYYTGKRDIFFISGTYHIGWSDNFVIVYILKNSVSMFNVCSLDAELYMLSRIIHDYSKISDSTYKNGEEKFKNKKIIMCVCTLGNDDKLVWSENDYCDNEGSITPPHMKEKSYQNKIVQDNFRSFLYHNLSQWNLDMINFIQYGRKKYPDFVERLEGMKIVFPKYFKEEILCELQDNPTISVEDMENLFQEKMMVSIERFFK